MLPESWRVQLHQKLSHPKDNRLGLPRTCIIGIGSELRGDDSAGLLVARQLQEEFHSANLLIVHGGPSPENFSGQIKKFNPSFVIFIDAAHMDAVPGAIQWIPAEVIDGLSASTHSLPLSLLATYLRSEIGCEVLILGIQPVQNEIDSDPSPSVQMAVAEVVEEVRKIF